MPTTPDKSEAGPPPSKAANGKPPDIANISVAGTLTAIHW
jgi:hypothetical protein